MTVICKRRIALFFSNVHNIAMTEDQMKRLLEENNAKFFGQVIKHVDNRIDKLDSKITGKLDRLETNTHGLLKRINDDDQERAVLTHERNIHGQWINQLASVTKTKLVPER